MEPSFGRADADHHRSAEDAPFQLDFPVLFGAIEAIVAADGRRPVAPVGMEFHYVFLAVAAQNFGFVTFGLRVPSPRKSGGIGIVQRRTGGKVLFGQAVVVVVVAVGFGVSDEALWRSSLFFFFSVTTQGRG